MKRVRILITIYVLLTAATVFAQSESHWLMKVHIPFSFTVADQTLPAGIYNIYTVTQSRGVRITNVDGKHTTIVGTVFNYAKSASPAARLVFNQYGSEYFLAQIWSAGEDLSRNPPPGKKAAELAKAGAVIQTSTVMALGNSR